VITIKTFVFNPFQVNTYVVSDESGQCAIIDPACSTEGEFEILKKYIADQLLTPTAIVLTHGHVDHMLGLTVTANHYKIVPVIHCDELSYARTAGEQALMFGLQYVPYTGDWQTVTEPDRILLGQTEAKVLNVPGHSPGGMAVYCPTDNCVFTGDALFKGSIGRTDLLGGDYNRLISHIKEKLLTLPPSTMVFPGHGPYTTIGNEIRHNPFLIN